MIPELPCQRECWIRQKTGERLRRKKFFGEDRKRTDRKFKKAEYRGNHPPSMIPLMTGKNGTHIPFQIIQVSIPELQLTLF